MHHSKKNNKKLSPLLLFILLFIISWDNPQKWFLLIVWLVVLLSNILVPKIKNHMRRKKYLNSGLHIVDTMKGTEFEDYLQVYYERLGYRVKKTPASNDYGADLILKKGTEVTVLQAKRYSQNVGIKAVQEISAAKAYYHATHAIVATNSYFTSQAIALAKANNITLINRSELGKILDKVHQKTKQERKNKPWVKN